MVLDRDLVADVNDELVWDPKLDSAAIAVAVADGVVTLRGTVGSLREKREAKNAAQRVLGVSSVDNQLQVRLLTTQRRADADIRGDVLQALVLDSRVPDTVDAKVVDGFVTLTGNVDWPYQRDEARFVAGNIAGTLEVVDDIVIDRATPNTWDMEQAITKAFQRNAGFDADELTLSTAAGTVTVAGTVSSWAERNEALAAVWAAPGVTAVQDELTIKY
jgi:osmotically-inducible protein OsmY